MTFKSLFRGLPFYQKIILVAVVTIILAFFGQDQIETITNTETDQSSTTSSSEAPTETLPDGQYFVDRVVDGDTTRIWIDGESESIRIIGLDTPETVDPRKPVQCFGQEASNRAKSLLEDQIITLELDPTQGEFDKYQRRLGYLILPDGRNFSKVMIAEGYAFEYTYQKPYKYQAEFKQAEKDAREDGRGLWSSRTCDGEKE